MTLDVKWIDRGRKAQNPADPLFPNGKDVDISEGAAATCATDLPFPAPQCGVWIVSCPDCGLNVGVTAAGRLDDPRSVKLPCKLGATGTFSEGKLDASDEGDLRLAVGADAPNGLVRVEFGKVVAWLALPPDDARRLAQSLISAAEAIEAVKRRG